MEQEKAKTTKKSKDKASSLDKFFWPLLIIVVIAVFIAGYMFVVKNIYASMITNQQKSLNQIEKTIVDLEKQKQDLDKLDGGGLNFDQEEENLINNALPADYDFSSIVIQMTRLAEKYGFVITGLDVSPTKQTKNNKDEATGLPSGVKAVDIDLEAVGGSYINWRRFVAALESSAMIMDVSSVDFSLEEGAYSLNLMSYYYPNK